MKPPLNWQAEYLKWSVISASMTGATVQLMETNGMKLLTVKLMKTDEMKVKDKNNN